MPEGAKVTGEKVLSHCADLAVLIPTSIFGCFVRIKLQAFPLLTGASIDGLAWVQALGCLIMGFASGESVRRSVTEFYAPLYVAVTTGYCGSLTTFSSWIFQFFVALAGFSSNGYIWAETLDATTYSVIVLCVSLSFAVSGRYLATLVTLERKEKEGSLPPQGSHIFRHIACILVALSIWGIVALLWSRMFSALEPILFVVVAPLGAIVRWWLTRLNDLDFSKDRKLPLGTLSANLLAVLLMGVAFTAGHTSKTGNPLLWNSLQAQFCGCLSTMSSFAVELIDIEPTSRAIQYALLSIFLFLLLCIAVSGIPLWISGQYANA